MAGASFIKDHTITSYGEPEGLGTSSITRFVQDHAGVVWATSSSGLKRFQGSHWQDVRETLGVPSEYVRGIQVAADGTLRIVIGHAVMVLRPGALRFAATPIQTSEAGVDFVTTPDGTLWLMDASRGARAVYVPGGVTSAQQCIQLHDQRHGTLLGKLDRDGTLWMTSAAGIHRLKDFGRLLDPRITASAVREVFSEVDGLSARYAAAFLEDREGNVWIGTAGGLDRFRAARLTRVDLPRAANGFAIAAGDAGALLVGIDSKEGAYRLTGKSTVEVVPGPRYINCAYTWTACRAPQMRSGRSLPSQRALTAGSGLPPPTASCGWTRSISVYRARMRQVAARVRDRLEARLAERIARELHDTLLQGMQGLIWRFQAAPTAFPPASLPAS